jgi:hypothetical protein
MITNEFNKRESYLHDLAKIAFVEGICGRKFKQDGFYPSDIYLYNNNIEVSRNSTDSYGSCDVAWNITLEKKLFNINETNKIEYLSFIPDIFIYCEDSHNIYLIEVVYTNPISEKKKLEINKWISLEKTKCKHQPNIELFEIPAMDILKVNKYRDDTHSWKFPLKFLDKYKVKL